MKKIMLVLCALAVYQQWGTIERWFRPAPEIVAGSQEVVLYSAAWCGYCDKAREQLTRQGTPFQELDIELSAEGRRQYDALGGRGIPLLKVGSRLIHGYSASEISALAP
ncbi:MAG: NrdH-redoxin [Gammaproteobacteria bacterium HGW-Gammaproteobacteria-6]|nr:MAG: NrdH-redoxin [Gammaproteobacteria bacterium HGW-Gammaproteobacteria-6]